MLKAIFFTAIAIAPIKGFPLFNYQATPKKEAKNPLFFADFSAAPSLINLNSFYQSISNPSGFGTTFERLDPSLGLGVDFKQSIGAYQIFRMTFCESFHQVSDYGVGADGGGLNERARLFSTSGQGSFFIPGFTHVDFLINIGYDYLWNQVKQKNATTTLYTGTSKSQYFGPFGGLGLFLTFKQLSVEGGMHYHIPQAIGSNLISGEWIRRHFRAGAQGVSGYATALWHMSKYSFIELRLETSYKQARLSENEWSKIIYQRYIFGIGHQF